MLSVLLRKISDRLPCRVISDRGSPYLERFFIGQAFGATFYLHRFVASDPAGSLHDHPWNWARSLILSGWYLEETRAGARRVRWYNRLTGDTFHRVVLPAGCREVWTLFFHGRYRKSWGFWREEPMWHPDGPVMAGVWIPHVPSTNEASGRDRWWERAPRGRDCPGRMA